MKIGRWQTDRQIGIKTGRLVDIQVVSQEDIFRWMGKYIGTWNINRKIKKLASLILAQIPKNEGFDYIKK